MSYLADSRRNFETRSVTQCLKLSPAQASFLRERFRHLMPKKPEHWPLARTRCRRIGSQWRMRTKKSGPSQARLWRDSW
jgi:hypothetical protein